jgi:hypothetical protein
MLYQPSPKEKPNNSIFLHTTIVILQTVPENLSSDIGKGRIDVSYEDREEGSRPMLHPISLPLQRNVTTTKSLIHSPNVCCAPQRSQTLQVATASIYTTVSA